MSDTETSRTEVYVLRRVAPHQWERDTKEVGGSLFALRLNRQGGYERGLSVYSESKQTPRSALQKMLHPLRDKRTVEELVANGWRVARIPISAFPVDLFTFGEPGADGHIEIVGTPDDFDMHTDALVKVTLLLTAEECLAALPSDP